MYMLICINRNTGTSNAIILLCRVIFFVYTVLVMNNLNQEISFLGTQFASVFGSISKKFLYAFCLFFFKKSQNHFYTHSNVYPLE